MVLNASIVLIAGSGHRRRSFAWQLLLSISADWESNHHSYDRSEPWPESSFLYYLVQNQAWKSPLCQSGCAFSPLSTSSCFLKVYILVIKERNLFVFARAERKSFSDELAGRRVHTWNTNRDYRKGLEYSHLPTSTGFGDLSQYQLPLWSYPLLFYMPNIYLNIHC